MLNKARSSIRRHILIVIVLAIVFALVVTACSQGDRSRESVASSSAALSAGTPWFPVGPLGAIPMLAGTFGDAGDGTNATNASAGFEESGRGTSVAVPSQRPFDVYLGTAGGGLWEAPNISVGSVELTPSVNPWQQIFAGPIGSFALDPASCSQAPCNVIWIGTGEAGVRRETFYGSGLYKLAFSSGGGEFPQSGYIAIQEPGSSTITGGAIGSVALAGTTASQLVYFTVTAANAASGGDATTFHPAPSAGYGVFLFNEATQTMTRENVPPGDSPTLNLPGDVRLAADSSNNSVLIAGFYNRGLYRKVLPSGSWCPLNPGAPSVTGCPPPNAALPNPTAHRFDHIAIATSGATVYATFGDCSDRWSGNGAGVPSFACPISVFASTDAGLTWTPGANTSVGLESYTNYDHASAVSPLNSNEYYFGGFLVSISTDGAKTFPNALPEVHPDVHGLYASPHKWSMSSPGHFGMDDNAGTFHLVYIAADGGLGIAFINPTTGATTTIGVAEPPDFEIDHIGVLPQTTCAAGVQNCNTSAVLAGTNDNGTVLFNGGRVWQTLTSADIGPVQFLNANAAIAGWYNVQPSTLSTTSGFGGLPSISFDSSATDLDSVEYGKTTQTDTSGDVLSSPDGHGKLMLPPLAHDTGSGDFYWGTDRLYRIDPKGTALTAISQRLIDNLGTCNRNNNTAQGSCPTGDVCVEGHCTSYYTDIEKINAISAIGALNGSIYVGMYSGAFWRMVSGALTQVTSIPTARGCNAATLGTVTPLDANAFANGNRCAPVTSIDVNPSNVNQAYVTIGGFNLTGRHVYLYDASANTWTPLYDGDLMLSPNQDLPAAVVKADPSSAGHVLLGTHGGLFERTSLTPWSQVASVPSVPVYDIAYDASRGRTYVGTHGRGVYLTVTTPVVEVFEGWMDPSKCPPNQPCIWDILLYGQGFQSTNGQPCTMNVLTPAGNTCMTGTVDQFSHNSIQVFGSGTGLLSTVGQGVSPQADGKANIAVCFNGNCVNGTGSQDISSCEPNAQNPTRTISAVQIVCPNNNPVVVSIGANCPQLQSPPATIWDPSLTSDPPPSSAPPITTVTLAATLDGMPMSTLCSVSIPIYASDSHDVIVDRARTAFSSSAACKSAGVLVAPKSTVGPEQIEDFEVPDVLQISAPTAVGRALYIATIADPSSSGAPGLCMHLGSFPGYATNQLDIMDTTFATAPSGAVGGSITFTETSPLGRCAITVPTNQGDTASTIAGNILAAYQAAYTVDSNTNCPYASNPGDLVATSPFVPLAPGTLNSIASTALDVCINDTGVGVTMAPDGIPIFDATLQQAALFATGTLAILGASAIEEATGGDALIANSGTGPGILGQGPETNLGIGTIVGSIVSEPAVTLGPAVTVTGRIKSGGTVTVGVGDSIGGPIVSSTGVSLPGLSQYQTTFPTQFAPAIVGLPLHTTVVSPGAYVSVSIPPTSTVELSTGTYYLQALAVLPLGKLLINGSAGPVIIYTQTGPVLTGSITSTSGSDPKLRMVYEGTLPWILASPLSGTFIAPNATMSLLPTVACTFRGSFFAGNITVGPLSTVVHVPAQ